MSIDILELIKMSFIEKRRKIRQQLIQILLSKCIWYAAPVDVLVDIGVLPKQKYEDWRFGKVRYLEAVCTCNFKKLSFIMKQIRSYAKKSDLKPSFCYYKRWGVKKKHGHKPVIPLRFSKSGNPEIEKAYATHYVDLVRVEKLRKENAVSSEK